MHPAVGHELAVGGRHKVALVALVHLHGVRVDLVVQELALIQRGKLASFADARASDVGAGLHGERVEWREVWRGAGQERWGGHRGQEVGSQWVGGMGTCTHIGDTW